MHVGESFAKLKPVYSVNLVDFTLFPEDDFYYHLLSNEATKPNITIPDSDRRLMEKRNPIFQKANQALNEISQDAWTRLEHDKRLANQHFNELTMQSRYE